MRCQKKIEPRCAYCQRGTELDEEKILCAKRGVVDRAGHCRAFRYDPLKRVPPPPPSLDLGSLQDEDFTL